jgi:RNA polymerase sigma-70 factor, ECF subfamily
MTMMRDPEKYDPTRGPVSGYLFGIARNRVMKHFDRLPREVSLEEQSADGSEMNTAAISTFTPAHWAEQQERSAQVRAAVLDLPAEFREAVVLCELEELSYEEAARLLECPIGTIRSRLHRGRALLLAKLEMLRSGGSRAAGSVEMKLKQGSVR